MKQKPRLGRGLASLIPDADVSETKAGRSGILTVSIDEIAPNPYQPRASFGDESIGSLAESIKAHGVLQPLIVRSAGDGYELVAGERRLRAARLAGLEEVPVVIRERVSQREMLALALVENLQREDLNPIEEARGYQTLVQLGLTHEEIAERIGKDRTTVTNAMRLLSLPQEVQEMLRDGRLTAGHGRAILAVAGAKRQLALAKRIATEGLSVRAIERIAVGVNKHSTQQTRFPQDSRDAVISLAERSLRMIVGAPVHISCTKRGGAITIRYSNAEELTRILEVLRVRV